jgi:hypothetical protein
MAYITAKGRWRGPGRYLCVHDVAAVLRTEPNEKSKHETLKVMSGQTINVRGIVDVAMDLTSEWQVSQYLELGEQTDEDNNQLSGTVGFLPLFNTSANHRKKNTINPFFVKKLTVQPPSASYLLSGFKSGDANINGYYEERLLLGVYPYFVMAEWKAGPQIYHYSPKIGKDCWLIRGKELVDSDGCVMDRNREQTMFAKESKAKYGPLPLTDWTYLLERGYDDREGFTFGTITKCG